MTQRNLQGSPEQRKTLRVTLLSTTDWMTWRHRDQEAQGIEPSLTPEQYQQLLTYRQDLRDWPSTGNWQEPYPTKPEWM